MQTHVAEHGEIKWAQLRWTRFPQIVLRHLDYDDERIWTSVHLALRKPR